MLEIGFHSAASLRGTLVLDAQRVRRLTKLVPQGIWITGQGATERRSVELLIEKAYLREYGSDLLEHYPTLMSVHDTDQTVMAAVGFRPAGQHSLFLEQYLDRPIEEVISERAGEPIERARIVEIGNLASGGGGASIFLFVALAAYLRQHSFEYAVVTATKSLRRSFNFLGFSPMELASASAQKLRNGGSSWGTYYTRQPKVVASAIAPCFSMLGRYLPDDCNGDLAWLFQGIDSKKAAS